jgi:hypothetical protein
MALESGGVYVVGGASGGPPVDWVVYSPATGGALSGWTSTTPLPIPQVEHAVVSYGGYLYSIGGWTASTGCGTFLSDVYAGQASGSGIVGWSSTSPLPIAPGESSAVVVDFTVPASPTVTPTRTRTPTPPPSSGAPSATPSPTCVLPFASVTPPYLLVDRNVFSPDDESLQVVWAVADADLVQIRIYDAAGEFVRQLALTPCTATGVYRAIWDGRNYMDRTVAGGVYIVRLVQLGAKQAIVARVCVTH